MVTKLCWEAMAHLSSAKTDLAGKMLSRFGEKAVQWRANPANLAFDVERAQARRDQPRKTGKQSGGSELNLTADDDQFHVTIMEVGKSAGGRLAGITHGDEIRRRADAQVAFARFEAQGLRGASGDERIELLDG